MVRELDQTAITQYILESFSDIALFLQLFINQLKFKIS